MKRTAEVVIVGGGVIGLSIAYHLAKRGVKDVIVVERDSMIGTGSTGRCAGGFRHQFSTEVNIQLSLRSITKLQHFEEELGQPIDFHQDGYLFLLQNERDIAAFRRNVALQQSYGIPVEFIEPAEIQRVFPTAGLNIADIRMATYCGKDGVSDPAGVTEGYRRNAQRLGVRISTEEEVTGIEIQGGSVRGVLTNRRDIPTHFVVNATGRH